jgi:chromosome segregation ATPase
LQSRHREIFVSKSEVIISTSSGFTLAVRVRKMHKVSMTRTLLLVGLAVIPFAGLAAEEKPATDFEARKASVANLEAHIAQREERLGEWRKDIADLDARIEKRVDELVKMLAGITDSQQSRMRVSQLKKESIEGLKRGIDMYVSKRKEVSERIRAGDSSSLADLSKFDERIIKRVDQITELAKSIPTHSDVAKYETSGRSYWNGYYDENSRITEEWRQNRRDSLQSGKQRDDASKALRDTLDRLDQRRRSLNDLLTNRQITESARELCYAELGQIDAYEDHLNAQLRDLATSTTKGGEAVGRDQAHDIELLIDDARKDLREDVASLFRAYDQFAKGRAYLEGLKENLAARKEWLEKNAPK